MLRDTILGPLKDHFAGSHGEVLAAYLFGSVARGQERPDSDVDVAIVLGTHAPLSLDDYERLASLQDRLSALVGRPVDLIPLDHASPDLLHHVLCDGVLLHDGDPERRVEFEIQARNAYFDLLPHLELYRKTVLRRA